jgi:hypothetical protein
MVLRFAAISASVAAVHLFDGLGFAALVFGGLIGLLAVRFYWMALPAAGLANMSNMMYANNTGPGKMEGALGVFPVEFFVFILFTLAGYAVGVWVRHLMAKGIIGGARPAEAQTQTQAETPQAAAQAQPPAEAKALPAEEKSGEKAHMG